MKNLFKNQNKNIKIILILTVFSLFGLLILYNSQYQRLKSDFISKKKSETDLIEKEVSVKFNYIHQLIRSIASFNQVRTIDRYGRNLSEDSKNSIRQLYRYAYLDVKLSEIYILPKSIDPDKKDPITGKNEEPILMFDDFIDESAAETSNSASPETVQGPELEEVEIHEYRLYKEQLEYLNQNYKNQSSIKNNLAPIVSGRPVITCDNTDFTEEHLKAGNDEPRNGLLFTTPVYNLQGQLHGAVSAVIRTKVFSEYLPEKYYSLNLKAHQVRLANNPSEILINFLSSSQIDSSDLIYSETRSLNIQDRDPWTLTAVADNNEFYQSRDLKNIKFIFALLALIIIFLGGSLGFYFHRLNIQKSNIQNITGVVQASVDSLVQISKTLKDNSFYISEVVSKQSSSFTEVAASSEELKSTLSLNLSSLEKLKLLTEESKKQCNKGCESTDSVVMSFEKISQSNKDFEKLFSSYDEKLDKVFNFLKQVEGKTKIINDIVFQMKLLSFNASVEAARAGEYGKGFSIVAEEVGKLAALSGQSSVEISKLMDESITETELIFSELKTSIADVLKQNAEKIKSGIQAGFISSTVMEQINENVQNVNETMAAIHNALVEQTAGIEQINTALNLSSDSTNRLNPITQQVSSLSVEIEGKSKNIEGQVIELKQVI